MSKPSFAADADAASMRHLPTLLSESFRSDRPTYFASFKTTEPVRYLGKGGRDALIQATLSASNDCIRPHHSRSTTAGLFSFACRENGAWTLQVIARHVSGEMERPPAGFARAVVRTHLEVIHHPGADTARQIWSRAACQSPRDFTIRLLDALRQAKVPLKIIDLQDIASANADLRVDFIFGLACRGWVSVDIERPLSDQTTVGLGPLAQFREPAT